MNDTNDALDSEHVAIFQNQTLENSTTSNANQLGYEDRSTFVNLAVGSVGLGLLSSLIFHATVHSKDLNNKQVDASDEKATSSWRKWFKRAPFYSITILYCLVRLAVNMLAAYLPFYLQETLELEKKFISIVPLIQFIAGFITSFAMEPMAKLIGKVGTLLIGCMLLLVSNVVIVSAVNLSHGALYVLAITLGSGTSTMLIQTLVRIFLLNSI